MSTAGEGSVVNWVNVMATTGGKARVKLRLVPLEINHLVSLLRVLLELILLYLKVFLGIKAPISNELDFLSVFCYNNR
jgi:hypothetical protein